jgi:hypothetical protein
MKADKVRVKDLGLNDQYFTDFHKKDLPAKGAAVSAWIYCYLRDTYRITMSLIAVDPTRPLKDTIIAAAALVRSVHPTYASMQPEHRPKQSNKATTIGSRHRTAAQPSPSSLDSARPVASAFADGALPQQTSLPELVLVAESATVGPTERPSQGAFGSAESPTKAAKPPRRKRKTAEALTSPTPQLHPNENDQGTHYFSEGITNNPGPVITEGEPVHQPLHEHLASAQWPQVAPFPHRSSSSIQADYTAAPVDAAHADESSGLLEHSGAHQHPCQYDATQSGFYDHIDHFVADVTNFVEPMSNQYAAAMDTDNPYANLFAQ